jgi:hypothetical protein
MSYFTTTKLSETTLRTYNYQIRRWLDAFNKTVDIMYIITHSKESLGVLKRCEDIKDTPTNRHMFISAITAYIEHELLDKGGYMERFEEWKKLRWENGESMRNRYLTGAPTELQKDKVYSWPDILKARDELELCSAKVLLAMYTYVNPVRADYYACKLCKEDGDVSAENYIIMGEKEWKLVLQHYKTVKKHGKIVIDLPNELRELLTEYLKDSDRTYLFVNDNGDPFTRKTFSTWAKRKLETVFKSAITLTSIRHSFTASLDFNGSLCELNKIAHGMGHSVCTQRQYKWEGVNSVIES